MHKNISILKTNLDDSWMRDIAPIFFRNGNDLNAVSFNFNGYGKYPNFKNDNQISQFICNQFNIEFIEADLTLEGGAITYDDHVNLFTTESVLLNSNRKNVTKNDINKTLKSLNSFFIMFMFRQIETSDLRVYSFFALSKIRFLF